MHHPICYYIPSHMLAHINVARARGLAEPGPAQQSAKVSEAFRQLRQQAAEGASTLEDIFVNLVGGERYSEKLEWL